jgi:hypothetical protein
MTPSTPASGPLPAPPRIRKSAVTLGALLLTLLAATVIISGSLLYRASLNDWRNDLATLSTVLAESTAQTISSARLVLDSIQSDIEAANVNDDTQLREHVSTPDIPAPCAKRSAACPSSRASASAMPRAAS